MRSPAWKHLEQRAADALYGERSKTPWLEFLKERIAEADTRGDWRDAARLAKALGDIFRALVRAREALSLG